MLRRIESTNRRQSPAVVIRSNLDMSTRCTLLEMSTRCTLSVEVDGARVTALDKIDRGRCESLQIHHPANAHAKAGPQLKIGIQGEAGSYSAEAAGLLAPGAELVSFTYFQDVYPHLENGTLDAAVLPFENTIVGSVSEQYDLFATHSVEIERECVIRIQHQLIGLPGAVLSHVREVLSHPVALQQCRKFFARYPHLLASPFYDTAGSVAHIMRKGDPAVAAIASCQAAAHYEAQILAPNIQDNPQNRTRFWMLRRTGEAPPDPTANKVSILFEIAHKPGALSNALADFGARGFNLLKIESRPIPERPFQYRFFADFACASLVEADLAIASLGSRGGAVRVLGRYRAASDTQPASSDAHPVGRPG